MDDGDKGGAEMKTRLHNLLDYIKYGWAGDGQLWLACFLIAAAMIGLAFLVPAIADNPPLPARCCCCK